MFQTKRAIELVSLDDDPRIPYGVNLLRSYQEKFHLNCSDHDLVRCVEHLLFVLQVNENINLTSITDLDRALVLHILDSLLFSPYLPKEKSEVLDIGTGAGYPGLPLALSTHHTVVMIDSVKKKILALQNIISTMRIENAVAHHERIEVFSQEHPHCYPCVVVRALSSLPSLLELARPLLKANGCLIASKGKPNEHELNAGKDVSNMLGYTLETIQELDLPNELGHRSIFVFRVIKPSSLKLPRAIGLAQKKPLA